MSVYRSRKSRPGFNPPFEGKILFFLFFFASILSLLLSGIDAHAAQVTLTWNASTSSNVAGYKIYYGTASGNYPYSVDAGNTTSYTLSGLSTGATYYIAAITYDSSGDQSGDSNEVSYTVPSPCTYSISPTSASFTSSGGTGSVSVTTQSGCAWTASSAASWMSITSGASGTGSGTVNYAVAANTGTSSQTAASTVAGLAFTVTEAGVQNRDHYRISGHGRYHIPDRLRLGELRGKPDVLDFSVEWLQSKRRHGGWRLGRGGHFLHLQQRHGEPYDSGELQRPDGDHHRISGHGRYHIPDRLRFGELRGKPDVQRRTGLGVYDRKRHGRWRLGGRGHFLHLQQRHGEPYDRGELQRPDGDHHRISGHGRYHIPDRLRFGELRGKPDVQRRTGLGVYDRKRHGRWRLGGRGHFLHVQ